MNTSHAEQALAELPETFRFSEALTRISERQLRNLIANGSVTSLSRGLYRRSDWHGDEDLVEIGSKAPRATMCLRSALARHDLSDDIPASIDIALPRGTWAPGTTAPVSWHQFDARTFEIGREQLDLSDMARIGIYSPERCIVDAFRLRHLEGPELAHESLRRWLRGGGQPSSLLRLAADFPKASTPLRTALEILL